MKAKGISTIGGKDIWFDSDVQRINDEGRGEYLGQFSGDDRVLAVFKDGTYYTTSYDLSSRYQGELLRIENTTRTRSMLHCTMTERDISTSRDSHSLSVTMFLWSSFLMERAHIWLTSAQTNIRSSWSLSQDVRNTGLLKV